ncbi:hypothetical protein F2P81_015708 [Scophthalmus maximus]|uniref:Uncharacterized protein n=1 Tax=Scophthalmus maximus TaxID=52904 RepID=A0A6A4SA86_SCOMX|nr:hypothetical protein F2P81_015708 [Scophthalmus maximus]
MIYRVGTLTREKHPPFPLRSFIQIWIKLGKLIGVSHCSRRHTRGVRRQVTMLWIQRNDDPAVENNVRELSADPDMFQCVCVCVCVCERASQQRYVSRRFASEQVADAC